MKVACGSANPAKVDATRQVFSELFDDVRVEPREVRSGVPDQPTSADEILEGAKTRARKAIGDAAFGVGIEAGLVDQPDGTRFDVQHCAVVDAGDRVTTGHGPGFRYPPEVLRAVDTGEEVNAVVSRLSGIEDVGSTIGAIGVLTQERIDRTELTAWAVWMAMVPRIRTDLYGEGKP